MTPEKALCIQALIKAMPLATPPPWREGERHEGKIDIWGGKVKICSVQRDYQVPGNDHNADFIKLARKAVPALVEHVRDLESYIVELKAEKARLVDALEAHNESAGQEDV